MRKSVVIGVFLAFAASGALAQTGSQNPPAEKGPQNSAINSSDKQVNAPVNANYLSRETFNRPPSDPGQRPFLLCYRESRCECAR